MNEERILALDMSTKTGFSVMVSSDVGVKLESYGQIPQIHTPDGAYPESFVQWANVCFDEIFKIIDKFKPDVLVVEETSAGSKSIYSQKILEWLHYLLAKYIVDNRIKVIYLMTEEWRRICGCLMSKDESKRNKAVRDYKTKNKAKLARDANGKIMGKITRKHVNIRRMNEIFGDQLKTPLRKKDEDLADSLGLGFAYHLRRIKV